jgi:hypothetical protein
MKAQSMKTNSCRLLSTIALTTLGVLLPRGALTPAAAQNIPQAYPNSARKSPVTAIVFGVCHHNANRICEKSSSSLGIFRDTSPLPCLLVL